MDAANQKVVLDLEDLYENAPCGYHSVGPDGTLLRMNHTELTWLGLTRQEVVGKRKIVELMCRPLHRHLQMRDGRFDARGCGCRD